MLILNLLGKSQGSKIRLDPETIRKKKLKLVFAEKCPERRYSSRWLKCYFAIRLIIVQKMRKKK